jgi:hypothetical protein
VVGENEEGGTTSFVTGDLSSGSLKHDNALCMPCAIARSFVMLVELLASSALSLAHLWSKATRVLYCMHRNPGEKHGNTRQDVCCCSRVKLPRLRVREPQIVIRGRRINFSPHGVCPFQPPCGMYIRQEFVEVEQLVYLLACSGRASTTEPGSEE